MSDFFVDTDVIIRLLSKDDPKKQAEAAALFEAVEAGKLQVTAPVTVIADAVYVLSSPRLYEKPRNEIRDLLTTLVRLPSFKIHNRRTVLNALDLYGRSNLDFGDALIIVSMEQNSSQILYSYDTDFDRYPAITRRVPGDNSTNE